MSTIKENLLFAVTVVGAVLGCAAFGYSLGKDTNDGLLNYLREKNQVAEKTEAQLRGEISALRLDLQKNKEIATSPSIALTASAAGTATATGSLTVKPAVDANSEQIEVQQGTTARSRNGDVVLTLVGIQFDGSPLRHKVLATVGALGKENKNLDKVDIGFAILYQGYEVRVVAADTFSATFLITPVKAKS